jgi:hypothetical protein
LLSTTEGQFWKELEVTTDFVREQYRRVFSGKTQDIKNTEMEIICEKREWYC